MKSYCCNNCLNVHHGRCLTTHSISDNHVCWFIISTRCFCISLLEYSRFQQGFALGWFTLFLQLLLYCQALLCLLLGHMKVSPISLAFCFASCRNLVHTVTPLISWKLRFSSVFFTCKSSKLQMSECAGRDASGTNPVRQRPHCLLCSLSHMQKR